MKLNKLRSLDSKFRIFGAAEHRYSLNRCLSEQEIAEFEGRNEIQLPNEYREFLKQVGNGGAGPYYGLEPLENGRFSDLDSKDPSYLVQLSLPFPHSEAWNMDFGEVTDENEEEYFSKRNSEYIDDRWVNGLLRISNFGCGVSMNLVVNGEEYGNIWVDDRCNDQGIYPDPYLGSKERLNFMQWYELWLDKSIIDAKVKNNHPT